MIQYGRMVRVGTVLAGPVVFVAAGWVAAGVVGAVGGPVPVVSAVVVGVLAIPALLLLARRSGAAVDVLALRRPRAAWWGLAALGGPAAVVIALDALTGGVRVVAVDPGALAVFLLVNTVLALLHEALPEELAFRGLAFGTLARRGGAGRAVVVTTTLFALGVPLGIAAGSWLTGDPVRFAPAGEHPVDYVVLLVLFGTVLALLRAVTGSLWACVAAHVLFLTLNRLLLTGGAVDSGVTLALPDGAPLLVGLYLLLAVVVLAAAWWRRASGSRTRRVSRDRVASPPGGGRTPCRSGSRVRSRTTRTGSR